MRYSVINLHSSYTYFEISHFESLPQENLDTDDEDSLRLLREYLKGNDGKTKRGTLQVYLSQLASEQRPGFIKFSLKIYLLNVLHQLPYVWLVQVPNYTSEISIGTTVWCLSFSGSGGETHSNLFLMFSWAYSNHRCHSTVRSSHTRICFGKNGDMVHQLHHVDTQHDSPTSTTVYLFKYSTSPL